jgi:enoyl-CoA hydratase/carnithine racemase
MGGHVATATEDIAARRVIELERPSDGVALVTWYDPELRNHGTFAAVGQLAAALAEAREGGARVCVLASRTPGHWLQHAWLPDLRGLFRGEATTGDGVGFFRAIRELTHPDVISIAAISGDSNGGGAELGWACDLRVAEPQVAIGQPEVQIGLTTGLGGTVRLARLVGRAAAAEMIFDGRPLPAARLHALGAINRLAPTGRATQAALEWAEHLAARPHAPLRVMKQLLDESALLPLDEAVALEQARFQENARSEAAQAQMDRIQARFDAGESIRSVYGEPAAGVGLEPVAKRAGEEREEEH